MNKYNDEKYPAVDKVACEGCQASGNDTRGDNRIIYADGSYHCHANCGDNKSNAEVALEKSTTQSKPKATVSLPKKTKPLIPIGEYKAIPSRGISLDTAKKYKCTIAEYKGESVLCMSFYHKGAVIAQKLKFKKDASNPKKLKYIWLGDRSKILPLWGMNIWEPHPKLSVVICEGETDMLCRSSLNGDRWPVLSLMDGASSFKGISEAKEYLLGFRKIILMFDGDEAGRKSAQAAAEILGPKAKIAQMPDGEDVCSLYQKNKQQVITNLELSATGHRPKDIVTVSDYSDKELYSTEGRGIDLPFPLLNNILRGLKHSSLYMFCAGSGLGKSTVVKEIGYDLMFNQNIKVGCIFLEQGDKEVMKDYIAMDNFIECEDFNQNPDLISKEAKEKSRHKLENTGVFYKHFGSLDSDKLISKIEYMMTGCECDFIILDHISMVVSGNTSAVGERKDIDILMTKLRTTIQATGKSVIAVSHLKRPPGESKDYNNGGKVYLSALRGSASLEQLSDYVIALERNQFAEEGGNQLKLKVLKSRRGGKIGYADELKYSFDTGRLNVIDDNQLNNEEET